MPEIQRHWHGWRGSDDQLARVFRATVEQAANDMTSTPTCRIDVEVKGDHEIFASPQQFLDEVTKEALRRFQSIKCTVNASGLAIKYEMTWQGPFWMPDRSAEVALLVAGEDTSRVDGVAQAVQAAVSRAAVGTWRHFIASQTVERGVTFAVVFVAGVALKLVGVEPFGEVRGLAGLALALLVGWYIQGILYPDLEVTQGGKSVLIRVRTLVWTLSVGLIAAGLSKLVFG